MTGRMENLSSQAQHRIKFTSFVENYAQYRIDRWENIYFGGRAPNCY